MVSVCVLVPALSGAIALQVTGLQPLAFDLPVGAGLLLAFQSLVFITFGLLMRRARCRHRLPPRKSIGSQVRCGVLFGAVTFAGSFLLSLLLAQLGWDSQEQPWLVDLAGQGEAGVAVVAGFAVLVVPLSEELLFRGYVFERLRQEYGAVMAYIMSSLLFALIHCNFSSLLVYLLLGLILAAAYHRSGTVVAPSLAHAINNAIVFSLLVLPGA